MVIQGDNTSNISKQSILITNFFATDYQYTQLPPVTWYDVYYKRKQGNNYLRRYVAAEKSVSFKRGRARREMQSDKKKVVRFKYGGEEDCGEVWKANKICNGPLNPGTQYRYLCFIVTYLI